MKLVVLEFFFRENFSILIFFFVNHVTFFLLWNLSQADLFFVKHNVCWFFLPKACRKLLATFFAKHNVCWFFLPETCCMLIFLKLVAYCFFVVKHDARPFLFEKHVAWFVQETKCVLIYVFEKFVIFLLPLHETCWTFFLFFVKTVTCCSWKHVLRRTCCMISSGNLICLDLCIRETCYIFISSPWNLLHLDFSLCETCILIFLFVKLVFFVVGACCVLIFDRET